MGLKDLCKLRSPVRSIYYIFLNYDFQVLRPYSESTMVRNRAQFQYFRRSDRDFYFHPGCSSFRNVSNESQ